MLLLKYGVWILYVTKNRTELLSLLFVMVFNRYCMIQKFAGLLSGGYKCHQPVQLCLPGLQPPANSLKIDSFHWDWLSDQVRWVSGPVSSARTSTRLNVCGINSDVLCMLKRSTQPRWLTCTHPGWGVGCHPSAMCDQAWWPAWGGDARLKLVCISRIK